MVCRAVLFDLDGTLLDTLDDIAGAANRALAARGFAGHGREAYRRFVGDGSAVLMERALPKAARNPDTVAACLAAYLDAYLGAAHAATRPYDGIEALLGALTERRIRLGVVTNKPAPLANACMADFFRDVPFGSVVGQTPELPRKPSPAPALAAARELEAHPADCWFVGDSPMDMECAIRAGMTAVGVEWGFRPGEELREAGARLVLRHPMELLDAIGLPAPEPPLPAGTPSGPER